VIIISYINMMSFFIIFTLFVCQILLVCCNFLSQNVSFILINKLNKDHLND